MAQRESLGLRVPAWRSERDCAGAVEKSVVLLGRAWRVLAVSLRAVCNGSVGWALEGSCLTGCECSISGALGSGGAVRG